MPALVNAQKPVQMFGDVKRHSVAFCLRQSSRGEVGIQAYTRVYLSYQKIVSASDDRNQMGSFAAVINLIFLVVVDLEERVADYLNRGERSKELCVCVCVCVCV